MVDRDITQVTQVLKVVWGDLLGLAPEALADDSHFAELGGGSLSLLTLQVRLEQLLQRPVTIADLLDHPALAQQAAFLCRQPVVTAPGRPS